MSNAGQHTEWGGSKVARNVRCTGSVIKCRTVDDSGTSEAAQEGTLAHMLAEAALKDRASVYELVKSGVEFDIAKEGDKPDFRKPDMQMAEALQEGYIRHILLKEGELYVEQTNEFEFAPGNKGTADVAVINRKKRTLNISDLKFGVGILVYVEKNEQLEAYAISFLDQYDLWDDVDTVELEIYQPRRDWVDTTKVTTDYLLQRKKFFRQKYDESQSDDAVLVPGVLQCYFCPYMSKCRAAFDYVFAALHGDYESLELAVTDPIKALKAKDLTVAEAAKLYRAKDLANRMFKALDERLYDEYMAGNETPGVKVVEGIGRRHWKDEEKAAELLERMRIKKEDRYNTKLVSPTQAETVVGKRQRSKLDEHIFKKPGKPTLVKEEDPRAPVRAVVDDFDDLDDDLGFDDLDDDLGIEDDGLGDDELGL